MKTLSVGIPMQPRADQLSDLIVSYLANQWSASLKNPNPKQELESLVISQIACFMALRWLACQTEHLCQKMRTDSHSVQELGEIMTGLQYGLPIERVDEMLATAETLLKSLSTEEI